MYKSEYYPFHFELEGWSQVKTNYFPFYALPCLGIKLHTHFIFSQLSSDHIKRIRLIEMNVTQSPSFERLLQGWVLR